MGLGFESSVKPCHHVLVQPLVGGTAVELLRVPFKDRHAGAFYDYIQVFAGFDGQRGTAAETDSLIHPLSMPAGGALTFEFDYYPVEVRVQANAEIGSQQVGISGRIRLAWRGAPGLRGGGLILSRFLIGAGRQGSVTGFTIRPGRAHSGRETGRTGGGSRVGSTRGGVW